MIQRALESYPTASATETVMQVMQWLSQKDPSNPLPLGFRPYLEATRAIWPELGMNEQAITNLAIEVYIDVASYAGLRIEPEYLGAKKGVNT